MTAAEATSAGAAPRAARVVVALAGRQNAGKTSLMMHLTGATQKPVNFPGSSVERREGRARVGSTELRLVDLPGIASIHTVSRDEDVALEFLRGDDGDAPDLICVVVDACKLSVELALVAELAKLGRPLVCAITKNDVARQEGRPVDVPCLARTIGLPAFEVNALSGAGAALLCEALAEPHVVPGDSVRSLDPDAVTAVVQPNTDHVARSFTDRVDAVLLHPVLGLPILFTVVLGIFQLIFVGADPFIGWIEVGQASVSALVEAAMQPGALRSFLVDGLINGVGSILVFLPQIIILMALVTLLEGTGYMARAAFLLDRILCRVGLSGRSFVPMVSSFACAVPGILAARIIEDERDRLATIVTAPLMSCSARLPVYVILIGAFFPAAWAGVVLFGIYGMGIVLAALVAWALRRTVLSGRPSVLLMELPVYQRPSLRVIASQVWEATVAFVALAGTVIFGTAIVIWLLSYYPRPVELHDRYEAARVTATAAPGGAGEAALERLETEEAAAFLEQSYLARMGKAIQPAFAPAGFDWRVTVGILAAFPARELIIPTLGILYSVGDVDPGAYDLASLDGGAESDGSGLRARLEEARGPDGKRSFTPLVALALMVFFALCSQCAATLGTIRRETRSWRWPAFTFAYMTALAWLAAVLVYQVGMALGVGVA